MKSILLIVLLGFVAHFYAMEKEYTLQGKLVGHADCTWRVRPLFDEQCVSGAADKTVKQWNLETQQCIQTFTGHADSIASLATLHNLVISGSGDGIIKIWDVRLENPTQTCTGNKCTVNDLAVAPSEAFFLSSHPDCTIKKWDMRNPSMPSDTLNSRWNGRVFMCVAIQKNNMVTGALDPDIVFFDVATKKSVSTLVGHKEGIKKIIIDAATNNIISASIDKTIKIWDNINKNCIKTLQGHDGEVSSIVALPDNNTLISSSWDDTVKVWDKKTGRCKQTISFKRVPVDVTYQANAIVATSDNELCVYR